MNTARAVVPFIGADDIERGAAMAIDHLRGDGVLAYPTETVYGFGTSLDENGLSRLSALKPRSPERPFLMLVGDAAMADDAAELTGDAQRLAATFWPGPLTLILRARREMPRSVCDADGNIALRWTSHAGMQRVIRTWGAPITSTSANRHGLPTASTAQEIEETWRREVEAGDLLILDGGPLTHATPSTIVDCTGTRLRLVRRGAISAASLRATVHDMAGEG